MVEDLGRYLGLALANLVNLFNPSVVVLDWRLETAGEQLLDQINRVLRLQALSHAVEGLSLRFGQVGPDVGILGAGLLITEKLFEIPLLKPPTFIDERNRRTVLRSDAGKPRPATGRRASAVS
jgi:hypothetical protein